MTTPYTPTTEQVRAFWASEGDMQPAAKSYDYDESAAEFDRWLAAYTADVQAKALREAADDWHVENSGTSPRAYRWLSARADALTPNDNEGGQ